MTVEASCSSNVSKGCLPIETPSPPCSIFCYTLTMKRLLHVLMVFGVLLGSSTYCYGQSASAYLTGNQIQHLFSGSDVTAEGVCEKRDFGPTSREIVANIKIQSLGSNKWKISTECSDSMYGRFQEYGTSGDWKIERDKICINENLPTGRFSVLFPGTGERCFSVSTERFNFVLEDSRKRKIWRVNIKNPRLPETTKEQYAALGSTKAFASKIRSALPPCPSDQTQRYHNCFGTYNYTGGNKYVGAWKDGKRHGQGTFTFANGNKYVGEYKDGKEHGQGTWTHGPESKWAGNKYVGEFKDSKPNGQGTWTFKDGSKYVGEIKDGKKNGQGTYTYADGKIRKGFWENGQLKYPQIVSPTVTAKKSPAPPLKPKIDHQKRLELARRSQEALQVLSFYSGKLDGIIGVRTLAAIRGWQKRNGYSATGEITEIQLAKLEKEAVTRLAETKSTAPQPEPKKVVKPTPERPDDIAVIIANSNYTKQGKDIPNVDPAYNDAESIKKYFTQSLGVREGNIIYVKDATGAQLTEVFGNERNHKAQLFNWIKPNKSSVYVYYAGHGAPASKDGSAFLVPADASSQTIEFSGYPLSNLYRNLGKIKARSVTVILEACFSGFSQSGALLPRSSGIMIEPRMPTVPKNVKVISAGAADQMASWEKDESKSLFTKYFLLAMSGEGDKEPYGNGDGKVDDKELQNYLDDTMTYYARRYYGRDQRAQITTIN